MKRVVIFAHFDKNLEIRDYVVEYLKGLTQISDKIIFVSDSKIDDDELSKIKKYIIFSICETHGEYDFGSYKRGFFYAKNNGLLDKVEELVFCNDSCYAPLFSFEEMFNKMSNKTLDFWGPIQNIGTNKKIKHIQSFFIVFKKSVFLSPVFEHFINSVKPILDKNKIIEDYECGMTYLLEKAGFKWDVYSKISKIYANSYIFLYKTLIKKEKYCFLKRTIPNLKARIFVLDLKHFLSHYTLYDYNLIQNDISHSKPKISIYLLCIMLYKCLFKIPFCLLKDKIQNIIN